MPIHPSLRRPAAAVLALALSLAPATLAAKATAEESPALVVVPDVRGQSLYGAAAQVAVAGLVPRHAASMPGNLDTSPVRRQWPHAGQRVPQGTVVALELGSVAASVTTGAAVPAPAARLARASVKASFDAAAPAEQGSSAAAWWLAAAVCVAMLGFACKEGQVTHAPSSYAGLPADQLPVEQPASAPALPAAAHGPGWNTVRGTTLCGAPALAVVASGAIAAGVSATEA
jgi:hypothetical protein